VAKASRKLTTDVSASEHQASRVLTTRLTSYLDASRVLTTSYANASQTESSRVLHTDMVSQQYYDLFLDVNP
jgi:hypothetical protein